MKSYSKKARKRFLKRQRQHQAITEKCPKIIFEKAGFVSLIHAGRSEEKGVDAALSADLIRYSYHFDIAVVVSGDADFLPVIQRLRSSGKRVVNVEYLKENGQILEGNASELMSQVDGTIRVPFDRMSQYMGYAKPIKKGTGRRLPEAIPG